MATSLTLAGLLADFRANATPPNLDLDGDTSVDFRQSTVGAPPPFGFGLFASVNAVRTRFPTNAISGVLATGSVVGPDTGWFESVSTVGHVGIRFEGRRGIHYGWMELTNPSFGGRPSFGWGGWARRAFYNPDPGQPMAVGDTTIRLRAEADPGSGQLRLILNCDTASFASGLAIQSRPAMGAGTWTTVTHLYGGSSATVPIDSTSRLFRVVE